MAQIMLRDYLQETEDAIRDGRIDAAFDHCRTILAQYPESLDAQRLLGETYLAQGHLEEALQSFDWILTNDPENVVAYCDRALISERSSDYDTALDCYQQAYELSHGNSQIRQEFNRLSAIAGQQGFMFSRAGLARLYMRGDLLTQAIQEWETVLALSPDRLDARTGLLETCWRETHYDRVEQLATQILQDVPGCLKALLLLAYVNSAKNKQKTQELLKQASALDPDLLLAQETFSDLMASQPTEPFLLLLKRPPALIETGSGQAAMTFAPNLREAQPSTAPSSEPSLPAWNGNGWVASEPWKNDATLVPATQEKQGTPFSMPPWAKDAEPVYDGWGGLDDEQEARSLQELQDFSASLKRDASAGNPAYSQPVATPVQQEPQPLEAWPPEPVVPMAQENASQEADLAPFWDNARPYDNFKEPDASSREAWENTAGSVSESGTWSSSTREGSMPAPPAWLNMLTQNERRQLNENAPAAPVQEPVASTPLPPPTQKEEVKSVFAPVVKPMDDEEPFSFGPEWLKSLGATTIEEAVPANAAPLPVTPPAPVVPEEKQPAYAPYAYEPQPVAYQGSGDESQLTPFGEEEASPAGTAEYDLLTTLEGLEAGLRSQGFVPLEPNSLLTIAKTQEAAPASVPDTPELNTRQEEEVRQEENNWNGGYQNEPIPSALAELGGFVSDTASSGNSGSVLVPLVASTQQTANAPLEEPSWLAALNAATAPDPISSLQQEMQIRQEERSRATFAPVQPSWSGTYRPQGTAPLEDVPLQPEVKSVQPTGPLTTQPVRTQEREPAREESLFESVTAAPAQPAWSQTGRPQEVFAAQSPAASTYTGPEVSARPPEISNSDFVLNGSELETTMKRPAVRLQPMQQAQTFIQKDPVPPSGRSYLSEQTYGGKLPEGNLSYQERLVRGYQHQLVGDYDEAMQEYRIIIRNSPELLGEVVSNVRALLKLAPKYSTGYRVLGDAYMRQGEYLQAMEAYNKALTMAKRAKG